jgi:hypothetical protein
MTTCSGGGTTRFALAVLSSSGLTPVVSALRRSGFGSSLCCAVSPLRGQDQQLAAVATVDSSSFTTD